MCPFSRYSLTGYFESQTINMKIKNDYLIGWVPTAGVYYPPSDPSIQWEYYDEAIEHWDDADCINVTEVLYRNMKDLSFNRQPRFNGRPNRKTE